MPMFDGLSLSEFVLLVAGSVLFVVLVIILLRLAFNPGPNGPSYTNLLLFFMLPVIMIGFPYWQSVKISQDSIEIEKQTAALQSDPNNEAARKSLEADVGRLSGRSFKNPRTLANLAEAKYALGHENEAKQDLNKALAANPSLPSGVELKQKMEVADRLSELAAAAQKQPANPEVKRQLQNTVTQASQYKFANPKALQSLSQANRVLRAEEVSAVPAR